MKRHRGIAALVLGPGTLIPAAIIGVAGHLLLGLTALESAIIGAALASTDPVLLRNLLRRPSLPTTARMALRLESGMNDVVLLPIVVLAILLVQSGGNGGHRWSSPGTPSVSFCWVRALGALVGFTAITLLEQVRSRTGVRRDYESLYALGVAFTAFAAAEAVGGSGFLAAFAAGLMVAALDVELCDCFLDYGQATAEMFLLFTFVAFGAWLIWTGLEVISLPALVFAFIALAARTAVLLPVLARSGLARARPPPDRLVRPSRAQLAAAGSAAGLRRDAGQRAPLSDHVAGGAALGAAARCRDRALPSEGRGPGREAGDWTRCCRRKARTGS